MALYNDSTEENDDTVIQIPVRPHDSNRNYTLMLNTITGFSSIYRLQAGYITNTSTAFLLAQHVSYRSSKQIKLFRPFFEPRTAKPPLLTLNYLMYPGRSSFWQIAHLIDRSLPNNPIIADNLILLVAVNKKPKKPCPVPDVVQKICTKSAKLYPKRHNQQYLATKKKLVSRHLNELNKLKKSKMTAMNDYIFRMKYQMRFSDEDPNKHLNSTHCVKIVEDACFEWNERLRDNKMFIESITVMYWKEIPVDKNRFCYPTIWCKDDNGYYYGSILVLDSVGYVIDHDSNEYDNKVGFVVKLKQNTIKASL